MSKFDLAIINGKVYDSFYNKFQYKDIGIIDGKITYLKNRSNSRIEAAKTIESNGMYITPSLIDTHTHIYNYATPLGVDHTLLARRTGGGVFVDAGSSGVHNFLGLQKFIIEKTEFHLYAFLNVCCNGLVSVGCVPGVGELQDIRLINNNASKEIIDKYSESIVGVKVRIDKLAIGNNWEQAIDSALELSLACQKPLMVHIAGDGTTIERLLPKLRKGDILSHIFRGSPNCTVTDDGKVKDCMYAARERGVLLDMAHGLGSMSFDVANTYIMNKFYPDIISSDVHSACVDKPARDLVTTMSKMLNIGMPIEDIVAATTVKPAKALNIDAKHGKIEIGRSADLSLFTIKDGVFIFYDQSSSKTFKKNISPKIGIINGKVFKVDASLKAEMNINCSVFRK